MNLVGLLCVVLLCAPAIHAGGQQIGALDLPPFTLTQILQVADDFTDTAEEDTLVPVNARGWNV